MREIKFRAWHKGNKVMRMVMGLFWDAEDREKVELFDAHLSDEDPMWCGLDDVEIMQYTGLKDKNGREICEGDILRSPKTGDVGPVVWDPELDVGPGFIWQHPMMYVGSMDECEVIGNIYENPELLA